MGGWMNVSSTNVSSGEDELNGEGEVVGGDVGNQEL